MTDKAISHIAVLTGKRGGYGAMKPMLRLIDEDPELRLSLIVTDQHLNPAFGATVDEVERDFQIAARVDIGQVNDTPVERTRALGRCLELMAGTLSELSPDILVLYGDRGEVLATATAALHLGIPIAHVQGGDRSGNADELMRHAVTKLSHLHFPSTEESAQRLSRLGEEPWRIHVVGDNHVDAIVAGHYTAAEVLRQRFAIPDGERPIIVLQHPETTRVRDHHADMTGILDAVLARGRRTLIIYPCSDHGYEGIVRAMNDVADRPRVSVHRNIDAPDFWGLMSIAAVMVGNSSAGLIETPYFRLPAVNIGERQNGRAHADNVIHCEPSRAEVARALAIALDDPDFASRVGACRQPFGDGKAGARIVATLKSVRRDAQLMDKQITY
jgi:GDP/UDP-N,N'-diacetylbacillosamine 2-epimerase (hydrolysing)